MRRGEIKDAADRQVGGSEASGQRRLALWATISVPHMMNEHPTQDERLPWCRNWAVPENCGSLRGRRSEMAVGRLGGSDATAFFQ